MKYVVEILRKKEAIKQLPVIRMEIDYELVSLSDAIESGNNQEIIKAKERLEKLRLLWIETEGNI